MDKLGGLPQITLFVGFRNFGANTHNTGRPVHCNFMRHCAASVPSDACVRITNIRDKCVALLFSRLVTCRSKPVIGDDLLAHS